MPDEGKQGFWSHWPALTAGTAALFTAIGTLIGGLAAAGVIGGGNDDSPQRPSQPTTTQGPEPHASLPFSPTDNELRLAKTIPLAFHPDCARASKAVRVDRTLSGITCRLPELAGGFVVYQLFESTAGLNAHMRGRLSFGDASKKCGEAPSGSSTYDGETKEDVGRLVCHITEGKAWIEWSNQEVNVYAYGVRQDADWRALFNAWKSLGPNPPK